MTGNLQHEVDSLKTALQAMRAELDRRGVSADSCLEELGLDLRVRRDRRGNAVCSIWRVSDGKRLSGWFRV